MTEEKITLDVPPWIYPLVVLSILITASAAGYIYTGSLVTAPIALAGFLALLAWLGTTYRYPRKRRILPLYIGLIIVLLMQGVEQWYFGYPAAIKRLFPANFEPPVVFNEAIFLSNFVLAGTTLFLSAGVGIFFHHHLGNYVAWLLMTHAVIGGIFLCLSPLFSGEGLQYVPGMVIAPLSIVIGCLGMIQLSKKTKITSQTDSTLKEVFA
ncbi:hypothetical protein KFU94_70315 [Chloroflexi bacterium TSY]|nr:hypothetical protein [Chloroflexi bacterium TSY]